MEFLNENIYIKILKFGVEIPDGFTQDDILSIAINEKEKKIIKNLIEVAYELASHYKEITSKDNLLYLLDKDKKLYSLNLEAIFKYLEYLELQKAQQALIESKKASKSSEKAFWVSIIALTFSIIFSFLEMIL